MSFIMSFYVRIHIPGNGCQVLLQLNDLEISIENFLRNTQKRLKEDNEKEMFFLFKGLMHPNQILCWNKPCTLDSLFADLLSKVEKIEGKEADVFDLKFN